MRGGGRHKDKKSEEEKKQVPSLRPERTQGQKSGFGPELNADSPDGKGQKNNEPDEENGGDGQRQEVQLDDGLCAMMCEQLRLITERAHESQVTSEDMQRVVEQVGRLRLAMADAQKQATNDDLERVVKVEESLKILMEEARTRQEEVRTKGAVEQDVLMRVEEEVGEMATGGGGGCASLVQAEDEREKLDQTCSEGTGKRHGGKTRTREEREKIRRQRLSCRV